MGPFLVDRAHMGSPWDKHGLLAIATQIGRMQLYGAAHVAPLMTR